MPNIFCLNPKNCLDFQNGQILSESVTTVSQLFVISELIITFMLMMDLPLSCICLKKNLQLEGITNNLIQLAKNFFIDCMSISYVISKNWSSYLVP